MNGGSNPTAHLIKERETISGATRGLTDDVRGFGFREVSDLREVATVDDPTGLCSVVKLFLNLRTKFVCGAGLPVGPPVENIQVDVRYIQQLGESNAQSRLSTCGLGSSFGSNRPGFTHDMTSYLPGPCMTSARRERGIVHSLRFPFAFTGFAEATYHCCPRSIFCTSRAHHRSAVSDEQEKAR